MCLHVALQGFGLVRHQCDKCSKQNAEDDQQDRHSPVEKEGQWHEDEERHKGGEMFAEKTEPERPQSIGALQHDLHQSAGVSFAMIGER